MSTIIAILVFITGLSLLLYPTVSNYWNSLHQSRVVANYSDTMAKLSKQDKQAEIDRAVEYNSGLINNGGRFTPSDSELSEYKSLLNADGTGMMGYVTIPKIGVKLAIYHTVDAYQVDNIAIVEPNDYGLLEIEEGKDLCTLFTCTPYGINTHRLLVRGHRVENVLDEKNLTADAARVNPLVVASIIGLILYGIGYVVYRIRKKGV